MTVSRAPTLTGRARGAIAAGGEEVAVEVTRAGGIDDDGEALEELATRLPLTPGGRSLALASSTGETKTSTNEVAIAAARSDPTLNGRPPNCANLATLS